MRDAQVLWNRGPDFNRLGQQMVSWPMITVISILAQFLIGLISLVVVAWIAGALFYDVGRSTWRGRLLAWLWIAAALMALIAWRPAWQPFLALFLCFGLCLTWWFSQRPSNHRAWDPNYAVLAQFDIAGDEITARNVRNTEYSALKDFTPRFETRRYHLQNLVGADVAILYWGSRSMSHPMLIFDFGTDGRLCISIEVRYRAGQAYGFLRSLYRQQEIMYVVSDERDAILKRTKYSKGHDMYLYRLQGQPEEFNTVFLEFVAPANHLVDHPSWYNGLTANCTTSIFRQRSTHVAWDWRWLCNGRLDEMLYERRRLDNRLPFSELKRRSWINEIANRAPEKSFGAYLRRELPAYGSHEGGPT